MAATNIPVTAMRNDRQVRWLRVRFPPAAFSNAASKAPAALS
jgi:hypothetical protein